MSGTSFSARFGLLLAFVVTVGCQGQVWRPNFRAATQPELPRVYIDTTYVPPTGRTIAVPAGGDFQAALDAAQPGDVITLQAGATFTGPFTLPNKAGFEWIIIRSDAPDTSLPSLGTRVTPAYTNVMPKLVAPPFDAAITTAPHAHHYRFICVEIKPTAGTFTYDLVRLGQGTETSTGVLPHDIIFDRSYLHGDPAMGTRRGIAMNGASIAVIDSYLADFKEEGADSQAIAGWNGPGPFKLVNNYLEGAGENVMFGGADVLIRDLVPSDIEIRRNHMSKPLSWKVDDPSYAGTPWTVKNVFELKNARRVLIEGNLFEHSWAHAQVGFAILLTVRSQEGTAPWSVVEDVTFTNNIVRHAAGGMQILAQDDPYPSQHAQRFLIKNNLFDDIGAAQWGTDIPLLQLLRGTTDLIIDHNTALATYAVIVAEGEPHQGFVFRNNIMAYGTYGIIGTGTAPGNDTLRTYFPAAIVQKNVFANSDSVGADPYYPSNNFFLASLDDVRFANGAVRNHRLAAFSPYKNAGTDGTDLGVDVGALAAAMGSKP